MSSWIEQAERALGGGSDDDVELVKGQPPPVLAAVGRRAVLSPFIAGFMWAAVILRAQMAPSPMDGMGVLLRLLALAVTLRTLILGVELLGRLRETARASSYGLALCEEGLILRTPRGDFPVQRADIIAIREHGDWADHSGRRWVDVYVVTQPDSGRAYLAIPPFFDRTPGILAERLMRWRGAVEAPAEGTVREPADLASKVFDAAAAGERPEGSIVIEHGKAWLRRGPYATILMGMVVLETFLRLPEATRDRVGVIAPAMLVFALGIVPIAWFLMTRYDIAPRKGIALVLTPAEMLMRTRAGVHRVRWSHVERMEITSRRIWSLLRGQHEARALVIHRKNDDSITYVEAFLGAPAEVVQALCDGYRKGILPYE